MKKYFDFMKLHYMAANFFSALRKNWRLLSLFGKAGIYDLIAEVLGNHYAKRTKALHHNQRQQAYL